MRESNRGQRIRFNHRPGLNKKAALGCGDFFENQDLTRFQVHFSPNLCRYGDLAAFGNRCFHMMKISCKGSKSNKADTPVLRIMKSALRLAPGHPARRQDAVRGLADGFNEPEGQIRVCRRIENSRMGYDAPKTTKHQVGHGKGLGPGEKVFKPGFVLLCSGASSRCA